MAHIERYSFISARHSYLYLKLSNYFDPVFNATIEMCIYVSKHSTIIFATKTVLRICEFVSILFVPPVITGKVPLWPYGNTTLDLPGRSEDNEDYKLLENMLKSIRAFKTAN